MDKKGKIAVKVRDLNTFLIIGLVILLLLLAYKSCTTKTETPKPAEPAKLAQLTVTVILPPKCDDCFDKTIFAAAIRQLPKVNVTEQYFEYNSTEGKKLIADYNLTRLPAAIITGDTQNISLPNFKTKDDTYYFTDTPQPYYDLKTKTVIGRISIIYITHPACPNCFNILQFGDQLKEAGIAISSQKTISATSAEGMAIINNYNITTLPTMILSPEAINYTVIAQVWPLVGSIEPDGMLVLRTANPPYYSFEDKKVHGLVSVTLLTDKSCDECYNALLHKELLEQSFGVVFGTVKEIDTATNAGKEQLRKYNITLVPTIIMDKEAAEYKSLGEAWAQVGSIEPDGAYVFRRVDLLTGVKYKDLTTGNITQSAQAG
ncbi:MAG: hypothetical protein QXR48_04790 [Candidatus Woesearchaeota archaeon]